MRVNAEGLYEIGILDMDRDCNSCGGLIRGHLNCSYPRNYTPAQSEHCNAEQDRAFFPKPTAGEPIALPVLCHGCAVVDQTSGAALQR